MGTDCDIVKMSMCFWCRGTKEESIIPTKRTKGWCNNKEKAAIVDYEPCKKCEEKFAQGIQLIEVESTPITDNQPSISEDAYPTGRTWVVSREAFKELDKDVTVQLVTPEVAKQIGLYNG